MKKKYKKINGYTLDYHCKTSTVITIQKFDNVWRDKLCLSLGLQL